MIGFPFFLTDAMINNIVYHINVYVAQQRGDGWPKLIAHEFNVWLGLTIVMGIHKLPSLELYQSNQWLYAIPQFKVVISRLHYQQIKSYLYFTNPGETHSDPIGKIRKLLNKFEENCRKEFRLDCNLSIDEMMVKTKSSYAKIKVRIPSKPIRDGVKIHAVCDSQTGYLYTFHVYDGTQTNIMQVGSKTTNTIATLMNKLSCKSFNIFLDNYYLTVIIFHYFYNTKHITIRTI